MTYSTVGGRLFLVSIPQAVLSLPAFLVLMGWPMFLAALVAAALLAGARAWIESMALSLTPEVRAGRGFLGDSLKLFGGEGFARLFSIVWVGASVVSAVASLFAIDDFCVHTFSLPTGSSVPIVLILIAVAGAWLPDLGGLAVVALGGLLVLSLAALVVSAHISSTPLPTSLSPVLGLEHAFGLLILAFILDPAVIANSVEPRDDRGRFLGGGSLVAVGCVFALCLAFSAGSVHALGARVEHGGSVLVPLAKAGGPVGQVFGGLSTLLSVGFAAFGALYFAGRLVSVRMPRATGMAGVCMAAYAIYLVCRITGFGSFGQILALVGVVFFPLYSLVVALVLARGIGPHLAAGPARALKAATCILGVGVPAGLVVQALGAGSPVSWGAAFGYTVAGGYVLLRRPLSHSAVT